MDCPGVPLPEWACGFFSFYSTRLPVPRVHQVFQAWCLSRRLGPDERRLTTFSGGRLWRGVWAWYAPSFFICVERVRLSHVFTRRLSFFLLLYNVRDTLVALRKGGGACGGGVGCGKRTHPTQYTQIMVYNVLDTLVALRKGGGDGLCLVHGTWCLVSAA